MPALDEETPLLELDEDGIEDDEELLGGALGLLLTELDDTEMDEELLELDDGALELLLELDGTELDEALLTLDDDETPKDELLLEPGPLEEDDGPLEELLLEDEPPAEPLELEGCGGCGPMCGRAGLRFLRGRRSCRRRFRFRSALAVFFVRRRFIGDHRELRMPQMARMLFISAP